MMLSQISSIHIEENIRVQLVQEVKIVFVLIVEEITIPLILVSSSMGIHQDSNTRSKAMGSALNNLLYYAESFHGNDWYN